MKYYVDCNVTVSGDGSESTPFKTISEAASYLIPIFTETSVKVK